MQRNIRILAVLAAIWIGAWHGFAQAGSYDVINSINAQNSDMVVNDKTKKEFRYESANSYRWAMICTQTDNAIQFSNSANVIACSNNWTCSCKIFPQRTHNSPACRTLPASVRALRYGSETSSGRSQCMADTARDADNQIAASWAACKSEFCSN